MKRLARKIGDLRAAHRERHAPSGFELAIADRIDFLDAPAWDRASAAQSVFLGRPFLRVLETAPPANVRFHRALVFRRGEPVAAVAAQSVRIEAEKLVAPGSKRAAVSRALPIDEQVLICGNLLSWGPHGVAFAPGEDASLVWPGVAEALYRMRRADRLCGETALVVVKDLPSSLARTTASLERFSYRAVETEPEMSLALSPRWRSYDDYLASLSASYRKSARKIAKDVDASGATVERVRDVEREAARIHALYMQVHERQKLRLVTLDPRFLPALARELGDDLRVIGLRHEAELVGFVCCLRDGDTAIGWFIGYDREAATRMPIYLRLLHAVVAEAIDLGCARLSLGRTALEPKARLGARPEPLRVWVRHRVPAFNLMLRAILAALSHEEPPARSPFKDGDA